MSAKQALHVRQLPVHGSDDMFAVHCEKQKLMPPALHETDFICFQIPLSISKFQTDFIRIYMKFLQHRFHTFLKANLQGILHQIAKRSDFVALQHIVHITRHKNNANFPIPVSKILCCIHSTDRIHADIQKCNIKQSIFIVLKKLFP